MSNNFEVKTNEYLSQCDSKDVISFKSENWADINKIKYVVNRYFEEHGIDTIGDYISEISEFENSYSWFFNGEECEILRAGSKGWQKGKLKVKVTLEFIPDKSEETRSPLDDVRQELR